MVASLQAPCCCCLQLYRNMYFHAAEAAQPVGSAAPGPALAAAWRSALQGSLTPEHVPVLLPAPGDAAEEVTQAPRSKACGSHMGTGPCCGCRLTISHL